MPIQSIALSQIKEGENIRSFDTEADDFKTLVANIKQVGLIHPPTVKKDGDTFILVAGYRRFAAMKKLNIEDADFLVLADNDNAAVVALSENAVRKPMDQWEEYAAFSALAKTTAPEDIADSFGVSVQIVRRRLALGNLHPEALALIKAESIDNSGVYQIAQLTQEQQVEWIEWHADTGWQAERAANIRNYFTKAEIEGGNELFDKAEYEAPINSDLFSDTYYFTDKAEYLERQQNALNDYIVAWSELELTVQEQESMTSQHTRTHDVSEMDKAIRQDMETSLKSIICYIVSDDGLVTFWNEPKAKKEPTPDKPAKVVTEFTQGAQDTYTDARKSQVSDHIAAHDTGLAVLLTTLIYKGVVAKDEWGATIFMDHTRVTPSIAESFYASREDLIKDHRKDTWLDTFEGIEKLSSEDGWAIIKAFMGVVMPDYTSYAQRFGLKLGDHFTVTEDHLKTQNRGYLRKICADLKLDKKAKPAFDKYKRSELVDALMKHVKQHPDWIPPTLRWEHE
ncbi:MAG: ParB N-terminal domain-containing protein [Kordiimonadaceae bacterium]|nr:ParB N-terminal domain-containing protein [Kordiimonadaceae bacterium]